MSVLLVTGLKKILGAQEILRGVDLRVERGQKVGCVGRNGEGKTTLLRIVEGEEPADGGTIQLAKGARIGYMTQRAVFEPGVTVRRWVESGLDEVHGVERELHAVGERMAAAAGDELDRLVKRHGELTARMEFLEGWEAERRVETVLGGIGLAPALWDREARTLSGGEKSRTSMARELVSVPDLLLLDEPTNHLDVTGIEWLEEYLQTMHSAVLMVSHDRRMLDRVVDTIVEVERGQLVRYPGNYSRYLELKAERFQSSLNAWEAQQDYLRKEEAFIKKHMGSQRTGEAKGRRKKLENVERLERPYHDVRRPVIQVRAAERGGELVLQAEGLAIGYGGRARVSGIDLRIGRGERVGIVGPNGSGKTTLLKVLAGRNAPLGGRLERGYKAACGYYDQETQDLRDESTPFLEIRRDHPQMTDLEIRSHLARFLFRGDEVDLPVRGLSGGERARLSLARLVLTGPSWLALDEPTNHLDLAGRTALEEMLGAFAGTFLCVTHDREMLDRLATRIIEVKDGRARVFEGNYTDYRTELAAERAAREEEAAARVRKAQEAARRKERRAEAAQRPAKGPEKRAKNPWRLQKLEEEIIALEAERERLLAALATEEVYRDQTELKETQLRLAEIERDLEEKNAEWEQFIG